MKIGLLKNSDVCYNSLNYFMDCIEKTLNSQGICTERIKGVDKTEAENGPWSAVIGINQYHPAERMEDGSFLLDAFGCPVFDILVDPPYSHHGKLENHMDNLTVYLLDQGHVEYCKRYYPPFKNVEMAYMLGPVGRTKSYEEKEIEVLFAGTLDSEETIINGLIKAVPWEVRDDLFYLLIKTRLEHPEMPTFQAMMLSLQEIGVKHSDNILKTMMASFGGYSDLYLRMFYRKKMITSLVDAGVCVHVAGRGWENLYPVCPDNLVLEGILDFEQTADLIADAKILLNSMLSFKDGIHDRVLTAMHNGAVCVTDSSSYLTSHFQNGQDIVFYSLNDLDKLPAIINRLLKNPDQAMEIAEKGRRKVLNNYTWELFVKKYILEPLAVSS